MRRVSVIVIGILVVAALVTLALLAFRQDGQRVVFADGREVELLGVTMGGQVFSTETRWQKSAKRWLPAGLTGWLPAVHSGSCTSRSNSLTLYLQLTDRSGAFNRGFLPWRGYALEDNAGYRETHVRDYNCSFGGSSNVVILGLNLTTFPRRHPSFDFLFLGTNETVLGGFRVPNLVRGPFKEWVAQSLPQTQTNGPVVLTLKSLREGGNGHSLYLAPKWELTSTNPAWAKTKPGFVNLFDATGNEAQWLSLREPAWKVETFVHRKNADDFDAGERWLIPNIPLPKTVEFVALDQVFDLAGVSLKVNVLAGAGRLFATNGLSRGMISPQLDEGGHGSIHYSATNWTEYWGSESPFFLVEARGRQPNDEIRFRVFDDQKRALKVNESEGTYGMNGGGWMYKRGFTPLPDTKTVSIEITLSRPLRFEFLIDPKDVQMRKPSP